MHSKWNHYDDEITTKNSEKHTHLPLLMLQYNVVVQFGKKSIAHTTYHEHSRHETGENTKASGHFLLVANKTSGKKHSFYFCLQPIYSHVNTFYCDNKHDIKTNLADYKKRTPSCLCQPTHLNLCSPSLNAQEKQSSSVLTLKQQLICQIFFATTPRRLRTSSTHLKLCSPSTKKNGRAKFQAGRGHPTCFFSPPPPPPETTKKPSIKNLKIAQKLKTNNTTWQIEIWIN